MERLCLVNWQRAKTTIPAWTELGGEPWTESHLPEATRQAYAELTTFKFI